MACEKEQPEDLCHDALVKENLIQTLYHQAGLSKQQSKALVEALFGQIKKSLESGEDLTLEARKVVTFSCSPVLRNRVNGAG